MGCRTRLTSFAIVGLLMLASEAAPQPPTVPEPPLVIEGRVLWIDFGSQAMALAPSNNTPAVTIDLRRIRQSDYHGFRETSTSGSSDSFSDQAVGFRHSRSTW